MIEYEKQKGSTFRNEEAVTEFCDSIMDKIIKTTRLDKKFEIKIQ